MPISLSCPRCGKKSTVSEVHAGKAAKCPNCKGTIVIPSSQHVSISPAHEISGGPPMPGHKVPLYLTVLIGIGSLVVGLLLGGFVGANLPSGSAGIAEGPKPEQKDKQ